MPEESGHEKESDERENLRDGREDDGRTDFIHRIDNGRQDALLTVRILEMATDILDDYDRIINEHSERENESEKRDLIDIVARDIREPEYEREDDRYGQGTSESVLESEKDAQDDKQDKDSIPELFEKTGRLLLGDSPFILHFHERESRRELGFDLFELALDIFDDRDGIRSLLLRYADIDRILSSRSRIDESIGLLSCRTTRYGRHVREEHWAVIHEIHDGIADLRGIVEGRIYSDNIVDISFPV